MAAEHLLSPPPRPIPVRSPLATPVGINPAGTETFVREVGSTCNWQVPHGASFERHAWINKYFQALTVELRHSEIQAGTYGPPGCIVIDLPEPAPLN